MIKTFKFIEEKPVLHTEIDEFGRETVDPTPISIPLRDIVPPSSMIDLIHQLYRSLSDTEKETFEDADDLECEEEEGIEMMRTPYEDYFFPRENPPAAGTSEADPSIPASASQPVQE